MDGVCHLIDNPSHMPDLSAIQKIEEPTIKAHIHIPGWCIGDVLNMPARGKARRVRPYRHHRRRPRERWSCLIPLNEILVDFNDRLKSITRGYGSLDYDFGDYVENDLVKMDILVHEEQVDAFSSIVHRSKAEGRGRALCAKPSEPSPKSASARCPSWQPSGTRSSPA